VVAGLALLDVRPGHGHVGLLAHRQVDAARGAEVVAVGVAAAHTAADRDRLGELAVDVDLALVGLEVDLRDVGRADREVTGDVLGSVHAGGGPYAGQVRDEADLAVRGPVRLGPEDGLLAGDPAPRA